MPSSMASFEISPSSYPNSFWRVHRRDNIFEEDHGSTRKRCSSLEDGWDADDTTSTPPDDRKNFLVIVKQHFKNHFENNKNSILVTGVWNDEGCSPISLFENEQDARMESRRYGDAVVKEIPADRLRKAETRVYGVKEMVRSDMSLKQIISIAYRSVKLRGNTYLVLHRIPGLLEQADIAQTTVSQPTAVSRSTTISRPTPKRIISLGLPMNDLAIASEEDKVEVKGIDADDVEMADS
jgi:hypothetical protein